MASALTHSDGTPVDKPSQQKPAGIPGLDVCKRHTGESISYYCATCETPMCLRCQQEDHGEHISTDLDSAVEERLATMKTLTGDCDAIKTKIKVNLGVGDSVLLDLEVAIDGIINGTLDSAEESARREFEEKLKQCRENSVKKLQALKESRVKAVSANMETLKKDHDRLSNAIRVASQVTRATKHEVALTYSTLAGKLQKLREIDPVNINMNYARVGFKTYDSFDKILSENELGVVKRPGIKSGRVSFSNDTKPAAMDLVDLRRHATNLAPTAAMSSSPPLPRNILQDAHNQDNIMSAKEENTSSEAAITLELSREFGREGDGKVQHARGVALSPTTNDIAVADYDTRQVKVYTSEGEFRFSVDTKQGNKWDSDSKPWDIAVSAEGEILVTDKTPYVKVYDSDGQSIGRFPALSPDNQRSDVDDVGLYCIATDAKGRILVGAGNFYVSIHSAARDSCHVSSISVRLPPGFMATTSHGHIIIGSWSQQKVMIIDQAGEVLHTLKPPAGLPSWRPRGVCCSSDDEIYIANQAVGKGPGKSGVHRYQVLTGEYMGCITTDVKAPLGLAVLSDKGVVVAEKSVVKIFQWK